LNSIYVVCIQVCSSYLFTNTIFNIQYSITHNIIYILLYLFFFMYVCMYVCMFSNTIEKNIILKACIVSLKRSLLASYHIRLSKIFTYQFLSETGLETKMSILEYHLKAHQLYSSSNFRNKRRFINELFSEQYHTKVICQLICPWFLLHEKSTFLHFDNRWWAKWDTDH
jgi:hypothetical protein